jgi:hypothetical protein
VATACSGRDPVEPAKVADGKLAPESAIMKWEQSFAPTTEPAHVIRRYSAPMSPGRVRAFYRTELERLGWEETPSRDLSYAEWSQDGMQMLLLFEPPSEVGAEWSLTLFSPD